MRLSSWAMKTTESVGAFATWPASTTSHEMSSLMRVFLAISHPFAANQSTMLFSHHLPLSSRLFLNIVPILLDHTLPLIHFPPLLFPTFSVPDKLSRDPSLIHSLNQFDTTMILIPSVSSYH